jgi:hypothetical protein
MKRSVSALILLLATATLFYACQKDQSSAASQNKARLQVYLTDDPGNYQEVNIDVRDVRINYSSDTASGWQSLANVNTGTYDILRLVNGRDTLLGQAELTPGRVQQIRLVLGPNNSVKVNNQSFPLETPSAQQSGLKLNIHQDVAGGQVYKLLMDFDAGRSIVKTGNNRYILKPVIRTTLEAIGGGLKGYVTPASFPTYVYAIQGTDTIAGTVTNNGAYMLRALTAGNYTLSFVPSDASYRPQARTGVTITNSNTTTIDTVRLIR